MCSVLGAMFWLGIIARSAIERHGHIGARAHGDSARLVGATAGPASEVIERNQRQSVYGDAGSEKVAGLSAFFGDPAGIGISHAAEFWPRPENEWQGMLVDMSRRPECGSTSMCAFGLVCQTDGRCGPCSTDAECLAEERCVLDHCLPRGNANCGTSAECGGMCVIVGDWSPTARGTEQIRSICEERLLAREQVPEEPAPSGSEGGDAPRTGATAEHLIQFLRRHRQPTETHDEN